MEGTRGRWHGAEYPGGQVLSICLANRTARGFSEFGRSISGRPGGWREFCDSANWKVAQAWQDCAEIVAKRDFESPAGFYDRDDGCHERAAVASDRSINLAEPVDHTVDYDRILAMLAMSVDDRITLNAQEFNQYMLDSWEWSRLASYTNRSYAVGTPVPSAPKRWDDED